MPEVARVQVGVASLIWRPTPLIRGRRPTRRQVLMGRRKGSHGAGTWAFPGGKPELYETVADAAAREDEEETGLRIAPARFRKVTFTNDVFVSDGKHFVTLYVEARWLPSDGEPRVMEPEKCEEWRWFEETPSPLFLPVENLMKDGFDPWALPGLTADAVEALLG